MWIEGVMISVREVVTRTSHPEWPRFSKFGGEEFVGFGEEDAAREKLPPRGQHTKGEVIKKI